MSPLYVMFLTWAAVTGIFVVLLIYRSLISMKEDDQLFLNAGESKMQAEQEAIVHRLQRITPYTKGFGFASLAMLLLSGGFWFYQQLQAF